MNLGGLHRSIAWNAAILALGLLCVAGRCLGQEAPQLIPYTIEQVVGGSSVCSAAADSEGDGCPALETTWNTELLGIALDGQDNLYIADTENNVLRRVDAKTYIVTVAAGSPKSTVCAATVDHYGDGCPATDGLANAAGGYTYLGRPTAVAISQNGDIYITGTISLVQKISAATGMMTVVAGLTSPAGKSGTSVAGFTGDGGPANAATVNAPRGLALDAYNDLYIADFSNNAVRVVYNGGATAAAQIIAANPSTTSPVIGDIYTIAGSQTGVAGTSGNNGPAGDALLTEPSSVAVDAYGNVFIVDQNKLVRMIYAGGGDVMGVASPVVGDIYDVAGGGSVEGNTLNWVRGTTVAIKTARRAVLDRRGNLFISDSNQIIWFEDRATGYMRPIAGVFAGSTLPAGCAQQTDSIGDNCPATLATINLGVEGYGLAVDANEDLYISDASAETIRKVSPDLIFPATAPTSPTTQTVELHYPAGSAPAATNALVFANSDYGAGAPVCASDADTTEDCTLAVTFTPSVPGLDPATLTTTDTSANVGTIGFSGTGDVPALALDPGTASALGSGWNQPQGITKDGNGSLFIADTANNRVVRYNIATQTQTVIAGTGTAGYSGDGGAATAATLTAPKAVAVAADGTVYIADTGNNVVRRIDAVTGIISTFAGGVSTVCALATNALGDGCLGPQATFSSPSGLAIDANGLLYVADTGNNRVRSVPASPFGVVTVVGGGTVCSSASDVVGDGCNALQATLSGPTQIRFDPSGNLYIADMGNNLIRRVNLPISGQSIVAIAGNGQAGDGGDGKAATSAQLNAPAGIALDGAGSIYIADTNNHAVRMVDAATGVISTIAGIDGASGSGTLPGSATTVELDAPQGVEVAGTGALYVLDSGNSRVLSIDRDSVQFNYGKVDTSQSSVPQLFSVSSTGSSTAALGSPLTTATGSTTEFSFVPSTTSGCSASQTLAGGQQCFMAGQFTPAANGNVAATYTFAGGTEANSPAPNVTLLGGGAQLVSTTSAAVQTTPASGDPQYGQSVVVTVTITPASQGTAPISGSVTLQIDGLKQAPVAVTANSAGNGVAVITLPAMSVGAHTIGAIYSGDAVYDGSTAPALDISVDKAATTVSVVASPATVIQFQSVTFTATITSLTGGAPTGIVSFFNGASLLGTGTVNAQGVATFTSATLAVGSYQVVAQYSGDTNFAATTSSPALPYTVSPDPPDYTLSLSTTTLAIAQGGAVQATLTLTPTNTLTGMVSLSCSGLPAYAVCTFEPSLPAFTTATDQATAITVTLWTNISPGTVPSSMSASSSVLLLGILAPLGLAGRTRRKRALWMRSIGAACLLLAVSLSVTACGSTQTAGVVTTPAGTSSITITATGPNGQSHSAPLTFTVVAP